MAKASTIIKKAVSYLGTKENPANSNKVKFNNDYYGRVVSGSSYPWCCTFVWDIFKMCDVSDLFFGGKKTAYCPDVENYYKKHDRWHSTGRAGDLCLMDFGKGRASHIGIVEKANSDGTYTTIEGNTSRSSDDNGGVVMRRTRSKSVIRGFARPDYDPEKYTAVKKTSDKGAIKWMQKKLNSLTSGTNIEVDGIWGRMTTAQLKRYWKQLGWRTTGTYCGKKTCAALYSNRKN